MKILILNTTDLGTNTYLCYNETDNRAFVVDPGGMFEFIQDAIEENKLTLEAILLTHGHFDHIGAVADLQAKYDAKVYMHKSDAKKILGYKSHNIERKVKPFVPDFYVEDNQILNIVGYNIKVMHTPGHSEGSVCYIMDNIIFCGDTLFQDSYGRVDFKDGSLDKIKKSIAKIFALEGDYTLLCGHEGASLLSHERIYNPINFD